MPDSLNKPPGKPSDKTIVGGRAVSPNSEETLRTDPVPYAPSAKPEIIRAPGPRTGMTAGSPAASSPSPRSSLPVPPPRPTSARQRVSQRQGPRRPGGEWAWVVIGVALFGVAVTMSLGLFVVLRASRVEQQIVPTSESPISMQLPTPMAFLNDGGLIATGQMIQFEDGTRVVLEPWDGQSRLTILLMGIDRRPGETGLSFRTDTILLLSLDPRTSEIGMLSIPRDLLVTVPGYGERRVNEPMVIGELRQVGYGPRLAMETVQYNLGIRVNHYIVVDFAAFVAIVDALGGIDIEIDYTINDPLYPSMNYGYDPFYLRAGRHVLDGQTALKFARTRHGDSDISRAERQQQVLLAIRDKAASPEMIPALLANASQIWTAIRENFFTDLSVEQLIQLGLFIKDIPFSSIQRGVIDFDYVSSYMTAAGASVLLPNRARVGQLMAQVFGTNYSE